MNIDPANVDPNRMSPEGSQGFTLIVGSVLFSMAGGFFLRSAPLAFTAFQAICFVTFVYGCALVARSKGYPLWWGLLGVIPILGLIGILLLPDRSRRNATVE